MAHEDGLDDDLDGDSSGTDLAVVGVACRFPGARTPDAYWENLRDGKESVTALSDAMLLENGVPRKLLRDPAYVKSAAILDDIEQFDAGFFGFSPREAQVLDPQHRFFLEVCFEALESAGHMPESFPGAIGVFGGSGHNAYMPYNLFTNPKLMESMGLFLVRHTGNDKDFLTTRASYCLDLHGPAVNVQTACSTSLVAIHLAAQSLLGGECDMALAGGVTIELPHGRGYRFEEGEILSPDGHCRAFDHKSAGTIFGSGCGIIALRRLDDAISDGDTIYGVVKSTAINNDGSRKVGYLAPSVDGQAEAIVEAITLAGLDAREISYVECHGTGTPVGDPIEVTALTQAFRTMTDESGFCRIGSVKTNIGHLDTAAGIASFIKVVQMMRHKQMAPTLHYEAPNPQIDFATSPFLVNDKLRPWTSPGTPRRAGVSSLGVGGTNAHIILEEAPSVAPSPDAVREPQVLVVSGRTPTALQGNIDRLCDHLEASTFEPATFADVSNTLLVGRRRFAHRRAVVVRDPAQARTAFNDVDVRNQAKAHTEVSSAKVAFLFPGGGAQYPGMMREIYLAEPVFKDALDRCLAIVKSSEAIDLAPLMFPNEDDADAMQFAADELRRATRALPALLSVEVALAALWEHYGLAPTISIGHSLGEYAAAYLAGVFSLEDALGIVACRGRLFEKCPPGAMSAVPLSEEDLRAKMPAGLDVAVVNGPESCVVSGPVDALEEFERALRADDVDVKRLAIDVAAHSRMLDGVLDEFRAALVKVKFSSPAEDRPFLSNLSGAIAGDEVASADYWARHLRSTVRFADGLKALLNANPDVVLLEVGPGQALSQISRMQPDLKAPFRAVPSAKSPRDELTSELDHFFLAAGRLWCAGVDLDATALLGEDRRRVPLPTYAFDHERHWVEPGQGFFLHETDEDAGRIDDVSAWFSSPSFIAAPVVGAPQALTGTVVVCADAGHTSDALVAEFERRKQAVVVARRGDAFRLEGTEATVRVGLTTDFDRLVAELHRRGQPLVRVVNLWPLSAPDAGEGDALDPVALSKAIAEIHSVPTDLLRVLSEGDLTPGAGYVQLTEGTFFVDGDDAADHPLGSLALGPVRVAPKENPDVVAALIDLRPETVASRVTEIVDEVLGPLADNLVALRAAGRYIETWNAVAPGAPTPNSTTGTIVVTGGLGGIGRTIARALAKKGVHFVMVGRTALPPKESWGAYLDTHEGGGVCAKIRAAQELEQKGATVTVCAVDVTDGPALRAALREASGGNPIRGVIHAAGVLDDKPMLMKSRAEMEAVLAPKVQGLLALESAVDLDKLEFFVGFSSTSVPLGPPGQVDYVAGNAFLNARLSQLQRRGVRAQALGWGVWRDVGMAAATASSSVSITGTKVAHPLLQRCAVRESNFVVYEAIYRPALWALDEHRVRGGGAVVPGTALLEIVRAAAADAFFPDEQLTLSDVEFLRPLALEGDAPRKVAVEVRREDADVVVKIFSDEEEDPRDTFDGEASLRAQGRVSVTPATKPPRVDLDAIRATCPDDFEDFGPRRAVLPQERILDFGPRWNVLRAMQFGPSEGFASIALDAAFKDDLDVFKIHPGMWDILSGFAFARFPAPSVDSIYVPVRYGSVALRQAIPAEVYSVVRYRTTPEPSRMLVDIDVVDKDGGVVAEIRDYEVAAVVAHALLPRKKTNPASDALQRLLEDGITAQEGVEAFWRALSSSHPVSIATPMDLASLREAFAPRKVASTTGQDGPGLSPDAGGPRDDTERLVLGLFRDLLGADAATMTDSFFDLGGHSLIAVRLFSKIKKQTGVDLAIGTLFTTPTAETLADAIRQELGLEFIPESGGGAAPRVSSPRGPVCLVPINPGPEGARAFFCVHGAGGNVMNFSDMSRHLGADVPFFGLQAKGVDGKEDPLHSIEEMAETYLEGVRFARPYGPYVLGGYSGGGAVALEMAKRLREAGEIVETVVFFDTFRPGIGMRRPSLKKRVQDAREEGLQYFPNRLKARVRRQWQETSIEVQRRIFERAGAPPPIEVREIQLTRAFADAAERYAPPRYDGKVVLFRAAETDAVYLHAGPTLGWEGFTTNLEIIEVPGNHDSVTREPNIFSWIGTLHAIVTGEPR